MKPTFIMNALCIGLMILNLFMGIRSDSVLKRSYVSD